MAHARFSPIDSFPASSMSKRILMYYTIRSTRITVVTFGSRHILIYADKKRIKRHILPEQVTCGTIISTPCKGADSNTDGKLLLCGTNQGSIFAIGLPASKEKVKQMASIATSKAGCGVGHALVYKYAGLHAFCIACIDGRLLLLGKDESAQKQLLLFHPSVLESALQLINGVRAEAPQSPPYQMAPFTTPSISTIRNEAMPDLVIVRAEHTKTSPYHNSLNCVQYLGKNLFCSMFRFLPGDVLGPVACFLFPEGEIWYRVLSENGMPRKDLEYLCSLGESCALVTSALIAKSCFTMDEGPSNIERAPEFVPAFALFGEKHNVCYLKPKPGDSGQLQLELTYVPYSSELRARVNDWNGLLSLPDMHLRQLQDEGKEINVSSLVTSFIGEQKLGLKASEQAWVFQDYDHQSVLVSLIVSAFWDLDICQSTSACQIQELLTILGSLNQKHQTLKSRSSDLSVALKSLEVLLSHVVANPFQLSNLSERTNGLMHFSTAHETVQYPDAKRENIKITTASSGGSSILSHFEHEIHVTVKCEGAAKTRTHVFPVTENKDAILCVAIEHSELTSLCCKKVRLTVFANILGVKNLDIAGYGLSSQFPVLIAVYSCVLNIST